MATTKHLAASKTRQKSSQKLTSIQYNTPIDFKKDLKVVEKCLTDREADVVNLRFGIEEDSKHTLESIGEKYSITRERVRQIENVALKKLSQNIEGSEIEKVAWGATIKLEQNGGIMDRFSLVRSLLNDIGSANESDSRYIELSITLSDSIHTYNNTVKYRPHYHLKAIRQGTVHDVAQLVTSLLKKKKEVMTFKDIRDALSDNLKINLSVSTVANICKIAKDLKVIDDGVGLFKWSHINPRNIHDKIVFVMKEVSDPMHFNEITELIRAHNFDNKPVNTQAVHNELIRDDRFVLIGRGIYALSDWGYSPGTVSDVITSILKKDGPLSREKIIEKVLKQRKVKKITIQLNLKKDTMFKRVGRNMYDLA